MLARLGPRAGAGAGRRHGRRRHLPRGARGRAGLRGVPAPPPARRRAARILADRIRRRSGTTRAGRRRRMDRIRSVSPPPRPRPARVALSTRTVRPSCRDCRQAPVSGATRAPRRIRRASRRRLSRSTADRPEELLPVSRVDPGTRGCPQPRRRIDEPPGLGMRCIGTTPRFKDRRSRRRRCDQS